MPILIALIVLLIIYYFWRELLLISGILLAFAVSAGALILIAGAM